MSRFVVAVTGGIASGKSAVTERFQRLGVPVVDADLLARELVEPGQPALDEIVARFGAQMLRNGRLDRAALRTRVFADEAERAALEAILHPRIGTETRTRAAAAEGPYVMLAIPLLAESVAKDPSRYDWVDRVLVIDVPEEVQIERLVRRDGIDDSAAWAMLKAQASRMQRLALADDVIDNSGTLAELDARVAGLHREYLDFASVSGR